MTEQLYTFTDNVASYVNLESAWLDKDAYYVEVYRRDAESGEIDFADWDEMSWSEYCDARDAGELKGRSAKLVEVPIEPDEDEDEYDVSEVERAVVKLLKDAGKLKPFFIVTVHEYRNRVVIDGLLGDSRRRGFSDCKTADDDGVRRHYFDDSKFVDKIAYFASGFAGCESLTHAQALLSFLGDGHLERSEVRLYDSNTTVPAYEVEYEFSGVDWTQFNWGQAIGGYLYLAEGMTFGEAVRAIVGLFDAI